MITRSPLPQRPGQADAKPVTATSPGKQSRVEHSSDPSAAQQKVHVQVPDSANSAQAAGHLLEQATASDSNTVDAMIVRDRFEQFQDARRVNVGLVNEEQLAREREFAEKLDALLNAKIDGSDVSAFVWGVKEGLIQGVKDGLLGMAWDTGSFLFQMNPVTRVVGYWFTGRDVGADEEAFIAKVGLGTWEALKKAPETVERLAELKLEMEQFLFAEGAAALTALINNDRTYLDSRAQKLSPLAQQALDTARTAITEIGIYLIDHTNAETFGKIVGQVIMRFWKTPL